MMFANMGAIPDYITVPLAIVGGGIALYAGLMMYTGRWLTPSAKYDVLLKTPSFELRRYHACIFASAEVAEGDARRAGNVGFRSIAPYIFGSNRKRLASSTNPAAEALVDKGESEKIAMTTPVVFQPRSEGQLSQAGQNIAMTTPVVFSPAGSSSSSVHTISFIMPSSCTAGGVEGMPIPNNRAVTLHAVPARWEAVVTRYGAMLPQEACEEWYASLLHAARAAGLRPVPALSGLGWRGAVIRLYGYDPPFIPSFLRKTEAAVEVEEPKDRRVD